MTGEIATPMGGGQGARATDVEPPRLRAGREGRKKDADPPSGATELFFSPDPDPDRPIFLFQHLQKTAGTSFRRFLTANFEGCERLWDRASTWERDTLLGWYEQLWRGLSDDQRRRVVGVTAHTANFLLPFVERRVEVVTLIREPVDRVMSQWEFRRKRQVKRGREGAAADVFVRGSLDELYARLGGQGVLTADLPAGFDNFFNGQSRRLLHPHYDVDRELPYSEGPPADADVWRERLFELLDERYTVGVREAFEPFVNEISERYGWKPLVKEAKKNELRPPRDSIAPETEATVKAYSWLDVEMYERYSARFGITAESVAG